MQIGLKNQSKTNSEIEKQKDNSKIKIFGVKSKGSTKV